MLVLVNDQIKSREDVRIDLEDRGYQFGDGIYEVISVYNGQPFLMDQHMQRLERSARELMLDLPCVNRTTKREGSSVNRARRAEHVQRVPSSDPRSGAAPPSVSNLRDTRAHRLHHG